MDGSLISSLCVRLSCEYLMQIDQKSWRIILSTETKANVTKLTHRGLESGRDTKIETLECL